MQQGIKDNCDKIKANKLRPYLVANIVEILDLPTDEEKEDEGGTMSIDAQVKQFWEKIGILAKNRNFAQKSKLW